MFSMIQVNRIYLIFNPVHFLVDSSENIYILKEDVFVKLNQLKKLVLCCITNLGNKTLLSL